MGFDRGGGDFSFAEGGVTDLETQCLCLRGIVVLHGVCYSFLFYSNSNLFFHSLFVFIKPQITEIIPPIIPPQIEPPTQAYLIRGNISFGTE
jgi:hypothetical protein